MWNGFDIKKKSKCLEKDNLKIGDKMKANIGPFKLYTKQPNDITSTVP